MKQPDIHTLGELRKSGYTPYGIKDELRKNMLEGIRKKENIFRGIFGYDETVIPDIERAIVSRHNILFLGLRGQAKTMMARLLPDLLDEYVPAVSGSPLNDDPLNPVSDFAIGLIAEKGDATPVSWIHRNERYTEKLATPDVSVADLIGDLDPIKAANLKLSFADQRTIHYGLVPRSNRFIVAINELPDLQPKLQVALFNILQEGDVQIRSFNVRIPLDIMFVFTANPEDYTNRGSIVTPLKDRIGSQILTHYPQTIDDSKKITRNQSRLSDDQKKITIPGILEELIEQIAVEARNSEFVDQKSGVSARLTITAFESMVSASELRFLKNEQQPTFARVGDVFGAIQAINGKIELVYEGEQEGAAVIASNLVSSAIRNLFTGYFPDPGKLKKKNETPEYNAIASWFSAGNSLDISDSLSDKAYSSALSIVDGLEELVKKYFKGIKEPALSVMMEFALHALAEHSLISKKRISSHTTFRDLFGSLMNQDFKPGREEN